MKKNADEIGLRTTPDKISIDCVQSIEGFFVERDLKIMYHFIDHGGRVKSFKKFNKDKVSNSEIIKWFTRTDVRNKIIELGNALCVYDTVADKCLLNIISDDNALNKDKIEAIKVWNALRKRVSQTVVLQQFSNINLENVTDDTLKDVVEKIIAIESGIRE